jgi:hypothetical protein
MVPITLLPSAIEVLASGRVGKDTMILLLFHPQEHAEIFSSISEAPVCHRSPGPMVKGILCHLAWFKWCPTPVYQWTGTLLKEAGEQVQLVPLLQSPATQLEEIDILLLEYQRRQDSFYCHRAYVFPLLITTVPQRSCTSSCRISTCKAMCRCHSGTTVWWEKKCFRPLVLPY